MKLKKLFLALLALMVIFALPAMAKMKLRLSASASATDQRAVAMTKFFQPAVEDFANFKGHWASTLFKQGTELEAIARGNLEMSITSAQEIAQFIPEFSIFSAGYVHRDAEHQVRVFNAPFMLPLREKVEKKLGIKLLNVMYMGRRNINLRSDKKINTPKDMKGVKLRMPGSKAWQFLGKALGANPTPLAFTEVYTALQTGAVDGQDNPIPTTINMKFHEVTKQVILTGHLVDLNYLAISKKIWDKLTPAQQAKMQAGANSVASYTRSKQAQLEKEQVAFLKKAGLKVYTPDVDAFRERVQKMYLDSNYAKKWPKGLLDKINDL